MSSKQIFVTKTFLPPKEEYDVYLQQIWKSGRLTNQGPLLRKFEERVGNFLQVDNLQFVSNGTIALQLALRGLGIADGEIITTPFTYVATTSAILWEGCTPVYADIDPLTLNIDPSKIEAAITDKTKAIMAVHVFGNPCDIEAIETIATKYKLKVIYDGAHAFGVKYKGKHLLDYGDVSTCSFHSTKLFHTIEGGCVIAKDADVQSTIELLKRFGHNGDDHRMLGINAKASEFQAAMGLCNLKYIGEILEKRKIASDYYDLMLGDSVRRPVFTEGMSEYNYSYYPIVFRKEEGLENVVKTLNEKNIFPRRYFYPSLNTLNYLESSQSCPVSEDVAKKILCLPLYDSLELKIIKEICEVIVG